MSRNKTRHAEISKFILENVSLHPKDITIFTAEKYALTRPAVLRHISELVKSGSLSVKGQTRDRKYSLAPIADTQITLPINPGLHEDQVWREQIRPLLKDMPQNVLAICQYGLTEMLNNVVDHSEGTVVNVSLKYTLDKIGFQIIDNGIGIFQKIQNSLGLEDRRHAILELAKGKLTTDPEHHTGEGIFFTSRSFDLFTILSGELFFAHTTSGNDWLLGGEHEPDSVNGTCVSLEISPQSKRILKEVFDTYASEQGDYGFTKTIIPVSLARYGDENLVSRSQAKRLLARIERFKLVIFDFQGVDSIGQAFTDEVFRVFQKQNPQIQLNWISANQQVEQMISWAINRPEE